jgi:hypothetical protein
MPACRVATGSNPKRAANPGTTPAAVSGDRDGGVDRTSAAEYRHAVNDRHHPRFEHLHERGFGLVSALANT